eukprot:1640611-Pyramimonas_sp.AAC.1
MLGLSACLLFHGWGCAAACPAQGRCPTGPALLPRTTSSEGKHDLFTALSFLLRLLIAPLCLCPLDPPNMRHCTVRS